MRLTMPTKRSRLRNARAAALLIVLLAATLAIGAIPAGAGQTRTATDATVSVSGSTIFYRAAPTQVNHLVIRDNGTASGFIGFAISDTGATIRPGPGCSSSGSTSALCNVPINTLPAYDVDLGDQNDTFDVLVNFAQRSVVNGGFGDDTFSGGPGAETFIGGDGVDTVSYASRTVNIGGSIGCSTGLFCGPDGAQNENDDISSDVEKVIGGSGADGLSSGPKATVRHALDGGAGNDLIVGNLGSDVLTGGSGQDTLSGFDGNDSLFANDGEPDTVGCGTGLDIAQIDLHDTLQDALACESVQRAAVDQGPNVRIGSVRLANRAALVRLTCPRSPEGRCAGTLTLRRIVGTRSSAVGGLLGSTRYRIAIGYSAAVRVRLAGRSSGRVRVISVEPDATGRPKTTLATRSLAR